MLKGKTHKQAFKIHHLPGYIQKQEEYSVSTEHTKNTEGVFQSQPAKKKKERKPSAMLE